MANAEDPCVRNEDSDTPGWYLVEGPVCDVNAAVVDVAEAGSQLLPPAGSNGRVSTVVRAQGAGALRAELARLNPALDVDGLSLQRIGRLAAAARMLLGIRDPDGRLDFLRIGSAALAAALTLRTAHRGAGEVICWHYRDSIRKRWMRAGMHERSVACVVNAHGSRTRMLLCPTHDLVAVPVAGGPPSWQATGNDPRFQLCAPTGQRARFARGWYVVRGTFVLEVGRVRGPSLYPDYGDGASQETTIPLPEPDSQGRIDTLVLFKHDVQGLRFDPTTTQAVFALGDVQIERVGRPRALWLMAVALAARRGNAHRRRRDTVDVLRGFAASAWRVGIGQAAIGLRRDYEREQCQLQSGYEAWARRFDTLAEPQLRAIGERAMRMVNGPLLSILLPVYETPDALLRLCLDSVLAQAYRNWELCIADDASPSARVRDTLLEYQRRDPRIRVEFRARNGHIAEASNTTLAMARGQYVALLDHDDELRPHALLEVAEVLLADPRVELIYSDEDKLDVQGRRCQPYFKPDWNPDLLRSQNYVCHLTVVRTDRARAVGGFRAGFEGSQDHDLVLRCTEGLTAAAIRHIPKVLYHWRATAGSTALHRAAKDYASSAGVRAVADHLSRIGADASVEELAHGHYRVHWHIPRPAPRVSIIIPTRDRVELLRACIESIFSRTRYPDFEVIVVDNQSTDAQAVAYLDQLRSASGVTVLAYDAPFNYSAINNLAVRHCRGQLVCLLNNDIEVLSEDWLEELAGHAMRPDVGAVGAKLYYPDGTIQHAGVILGLGGIANHVYMGQPRGCPGHGARALVTQNLSAVTGACLMMRRALYLELGGLDERLQVAFNDIDLCLRAMAAGYRNVWTPFAELIHHESATRGGEDSEEKVARFQGEVRLMEGRWGDLLENDPAYNPNLSLDDTNCTLANPPRA